MKRLYNGTLVPQNKEVTGERNLLPQSSIEKGLILCKN